MVWRLLIVGVMAVVASCGRDAPLPGPDPIPGDGGSSGPVVFVGAGDIAECGSAGAEATARLLDGIDGTVFTAGDNAYFSGTAAEFGNCYAPTWGRHLARTKATAGNHDYLSPGATPYFAYFGPAAGPPGQGYYAYTLGAWRIIALNSEVGVEASSPQLAWLRSELSGHASRCTAAIFHRPRFSSGPNGDNPDMGAIWHLLYDAGVEFVVNGHDHIYERFAPQDAAGRPDPAQGIRQFTAGTGGVFLYPIHGARANSEVRVSAWGVLRFTLTGGGFQWTFVAADHGVFLDAGSGQCH